MTKPTPITDGAVFDLVAAARELRSDDAYRRDGHTARTLIREPTIRIVLVVMTAGSRIADHAVPEIASIHVISGSVRLTRSGDAIELPAGRMLAIAPDQPHGLEALADAALVLTLARCGRG